MAETKLIRDHHLLTRNLKLNDKYISNDGGDEGISIDDDGNVSMHPYGQDVYEFGLSAMKMKYHGDPSNDYLEISVVSGGNALIKTYASPDNNDAGLILWPDGNLTLRGSGAQGIVILPELKTASNVADASVTIEETLNHDSAGGSDIHYGVRYLQTQTDISGWDTVYLMYIYGGSGKLFYINNNGEAFLSASRKLYLGHADESIYGDGTDIHSPRGYVASGRV